MLLFVVCFIAVFLVITIVMAKFYFTDRSRMTSSTTGLVVESSEAMHVSEAGRVGSTTLLIRYVAGGREHRLTHRFEGARAGAFPPGRALTVRYNPATPSMAEVDVI